MLDERELLQGRNGAVSVIALAEKGALFDPGPCMYMEKMATGADTNPHMVRKSHCMTQKISCKLFADLAFHSLGFEADCLTWPT